MTANRMKAAWLATAGAMLALTSGASFGAASITIVNVNAPNEGFNDPTLVAPVGGNTGTTLGQQRLNAFQFAAAKWGATLDSVPPIFVRAQFSALACTATGAVLGSAGATATASGLQNVPPELSNLNYSYALANKIEGVELGPTPGPHINANFNINLGQPNCLAGVPFYLGLDNNHGTAIDLVTVLLHEFAHGLGFQTFTNGTTGAFRLGLPSIYDVFLFDNTIGLTWAQMTAAQRQQSAVNPRNVVWIGTRVTAAVPLVLSAGTPFMSATNSTPVPIPAKFLVGAAGFGTQLTAGGLTGEVMPVVDTSPAGNACTPFSAANALAVNGRIALVDRGVCGFTVKALNAQNAGAIAVIVADNVAGSPPAPLGGVDPAVTIPAVRITLADGNAIKSALRFRSRTHSGVFATLAVDPAVLAGADAAGRIFAFTPTPFIGGSSVSHYDQSAFRNQLMEPNINADLTHEVAPPFDLTLQLLLDEGW